MSVSKLYFAAKSYSGQTSLWVTDGTVAGTHSVIVARAGFLGVDASSFAAVGATVVYGAHSSGTFTSDLFAIDGNTNAVQDLAVVDAGRLTGLTPTDLKAVGNVVWFKGTTAAGIGNLYKTDGTALGTSAVLTAPAGFTIIEDIVPFNGGFVFEGVGFSPAANATIEALYLTDGTLSGTRGFLISSGIYGPNVPANGLATIGNKLILAGADSSDKRGLFVSDGTLAGSTELTVSGLGIGGRFADFTSFGDKVGFFAPDRIGIGGVWVTDGTAAGTIQLPNLSSYVFNNAMVALPNGNLAFIAGFGGGAPAIWITDGTAAGTHQLIVPGASGSGLKPNSILSFGSQFVFDGTTGNGDPAVFISDGTTAGTRFLQGNITIQNPGIGSNSAFVTIPYDQITDVPGTNIYTGTGSATALLVNETRRGDTFSLRTNGSVVFTHHGQTDTLTNIPQIQFIDGALTFDATAPVASIYRLYQAGLGRVPDQDGLNYWLGTLQQGAPLTALADSFLASNEFTARFGADLSHSTFVTQIYQNVLGRAPDAGGLQYWTSSLDTGGRTMAQTLASISESAENINATAPSVTAGLWVANETAGSVARLFDSAFGRKPDASGLQFWTQRVSSGTSTLTGMAAFFAASAEFVSKYGALDNGGFVAATYSNSLHRVADSAGAAYWKNSLDQGNSRATVLLGFSESAEHKSLTMMNVISNVSSQYGIATL